MSNLSELLPAGGGQNNFTFTASGAISNGDPVILNPDGTVTSVGNVAEATGSVTTYESGVTNVPSACYDAANNKVIIAYQDEGNSFYGTAVVGTVNGFDNSISFGTPVVFESGTVQNISAVFDAGAGKVLIAYRDQSNSNYGTAIVGTVNGTVISFANVAIFNASNTLYIKASYNPVTQNSLIVFQDNLNSRCQGVVASIGGGALGFGSIVTFVSNNAIFLALDYDASAGQHLLAYHDGATNQGKITTATVSGTSVSFGTVTNFTTDTPYYNNVVYDSSAQKSTVFFSAFNDSSKGKAVVVTISGGSLSVGSVAEFESGTAYDLGASYNAFANKTDVSYRAGSNNNYGTYAVGTTSGTSISFGTPTVFDSSTTKHHASTYDSDQLRVVFAFVSSNIGKSVVFRNAGTNVTAENFIGLAGQAISDTASGTINVIGSLNEGQSSLTIGSDYYVQDDGTLSTTTSDVKVGKAISATQINMKNRS